jgi:hypothetical protein
LSTNVPIVSQPLMHIAGWLLMLSTGVRAFFYPRLRHAPLPRGPLPPRASPSVTLSTTASAAAAAAAAAAAISAAAMLAAAAVAAR